MPKIVAYTALHYGKSYLDSAIRSVIDYVDEWWILYSDVGSHGTRTDIPCPDTREELLAIAQQAAGSKLGWVDGRWGRETDQRSMIHELAPDADVILVVDSDEVFDDGLAQEAIEYALTSPVSRIRLPFWHLWRSFKRGFIHDPAFPIRVIVPNASEGIITMPTHKKVWHFGYASPVEIVTYKWCGIHGHQAEIRQDIDWLHDVYIANRQFDCHPVGSPYWDCEDIDLSTLPKILENHPFRHLEVIE